MLSPRYLEGAADTLVEIYSQLETDILCDMARRIAKLGKVTDAADYQARILAEAGGLRQNIAKILKGYDKKIIKAVQETYIEALKKNTANDNRIFKAATGRTVSDQSAQQTLATVQNAHNNLSRLTRTTAATSQQQFVRQANRVFMEVQSGAFDYESATRHAVNDMAERGITTVQYQNGKPVTRTIEATVRMNVLTGINNTAATVTMSNCADLGCDLVEVSAHIGARDRDGPNPWSNHEAWQGKIYKLNGSTDKYPNFYDTCGYGEADGICGINCRHSFYPYFEGAEERYSKDELDDMKDKEVEYNGQKMSRYEAEQYQRGVERNIRKYKRLAETQDAANIDNTQARQKIGEWQARERDFSRQTGLEREYTREYIGTKDGKQITGIPLSVTGYSESLQKAQDIKRLDNARKKVIAEIPQGKPMNFRQADGGAPNPNFKKGGGYATNCQTSVVAYELRRRGYDVEARPNSKGSMLDVLSKNTRLAWVDKTTGKNPDYILPSQSTCKKSFDWIKQEIKPQNRYTIEFQWKNEAHGHIVHIYKNTKNELSVYDTQNGINTRGDDRVLEYIKKVRPSTIKLLDVENCDINMNVANEILQGAKK